MRHPQFQRLMARVLSMFRRRSYALATLLILVFAASQQGLAQCSEKPTVWMSEYTAASHLLASRKFVFPAEAPMLARIRTVVITVSVNRTGAICKAKATSGPSELRQAAEQNVKSYWRYRPFLLDGKPVVVQFPVTVSFVLSADKRNVKVPEIAKVIPHEQTPLLRADSGAVRI